MKSSGRNAPRRSPVSEPGESGARVTSHRASPQSSRVLVEHSRASSVESHLWLAIASELGSSVPDRGASSSPGRRQVAYTRQYGPLQNLLWPYSTWDYPAAGLNMSVLDLAKFFTALTTGKLLRQATIESMWEQLQLESGTK